MTAEIRLIAMVDLLIKNVQSLANTVLELQNENIEIRGWCNHTIKMTEENNTILAQEIKKLRDNK